jgi:sugar (pentulose or hexulose) kinase
MVKGRTHETSGLGVAIITAKGIGIYSSLDEAIDNMIKIKRVFEPDPNHVQIYKELYANVYSKMYQALEPLYLQIQQITGYPK